MRRMAQQNGVRPHAVISDSRPTNALHRRLAQLLAEADVLLDRAPVATARELGRLLKYLHEAAGIVLALQHTTKALAAPNHPVMSPGHAIWLAQAKAGLGAVSVTPGFRDAVVAFDGLTARLPRGLADVIAILAAEASCEIDGFPGWLDYDSLGVKLGASGPRLNRHAVANRLYRLRKALAAAGLNPNLVETDRAAAAVRLRHRRFRLSTAPETSGGRAFIERQ